MLHTLDTGLVRGRPGLSNRDFCEPFRSPELFHLFASSHLGIMGKEGGILRTLGGSECCVRAAKGRTGQRKVGEGHRVRDQVTRGARGKVRLNISKSANQALCILVEGLP